LKITSGFNESKIWSFGKDQSLSGLIEVGGLAVDDDVRDSLQNHINFMNDKWKSGNQSIAFPPF
jgi:hypothetical protein